eukprot:TRINITY_DN58797_c0_g1_i1.p1 TRINITY_DN58797_c0_g1~~TRINITY_DN58797_c0_g1_i1.p1  ORF type:complete len:313 (+),score=17.77 TRINITY_DN58797_c0_g1_i1:90-1028(+)
MAIPLCLVASLLGFASAAPITRRERPLHVVLTADALLERADPMPSMGDPPMPDNEPSEGSNITTDASQADPEIRFATEDALWDQIRNRSRACIGMPDPASDKVYSTWPKKWQSTFVVGPHPRGNHYHNVEHGVYLTKAVDAELAKVSGVLHVLEVGGGLGQNLYDLTSPRVAAHLNYTCLDKTPSPRCCGYPGKDLAIFPADSFDLVLASYMLHHAGAAGQRVIESLVREMHRVLKPGGKLLLQEDGVSNEQCRHRYRKKHHEPRGIFLDQSGWAQLLEGVGLKGSKPQFYKKATACPRQYYQEFSKVAHRF